MTKDERLTMIRQAVDQLEGAVGLLKSAEFDPKSIRVISKVVDLIYDLHWDDLIDGHLAAIGQEFWNEVDDESVAEAAVLEALGRKVGDD